MRVREFPSERERGKVSVATLSNLWLSRVQTGRNILPTAEYNNTVYFLKLHLNGEFRFKRTHKDISDWECTYSQKRKEHSRSAKINQF